MIQRGMCFRSVQLLLLALSLLTVALAEDANGYNDYYGNNGNNYNYNNKNNGNNYNNNGNNNNGYYYNDDGGANDNNDDAVQNNNVAYDDGYYNNNYNNGAANGNDDQYQAYNNNNAGEDDDYIKYWTEYAILPKRCIVYNNEDVIVFTAHEQKYKQCSDTPMGTYIAPVNKFLEGYLEQKAQDNQDQGIDDYAEPDVAQYVYCTPYVIENQQFYFQIGCADGTSQSLAVNIYTDNTCTTRSKVNGMDDANIDVSAIQIPFKKCTACVNWFDLDDDNVDDQYFENHQTYAPFCSTAWAQKRECGRKCQHTGLEKTQKEGWNTSDKVLLAILSAFGISMLVLIVRRRQRMSNKDALLEQAAMSAAGLQQPHVIGVCILVVMVVAVFALLGLKNITWALLLLINTALFVYLMKLTVDSSISSGETVVGPDGTIVRRDSDDSSIESQSRESSRRAGTFVLPTLT